MTVSEALRIGQADKAIEAWPLRGRFHLCHDEEKTLTRLVEVWERHVKASGTRHWPLIRSGVPPRVQKQASNPTCHE